MKNIVAEVQGSKLVITIDLTKNQGKSKSGKSTVVASTLGNAVVPGAPANFRLGVNAYLSE